MSIVTKLKQMTGMAKAAPEPQPKAETATPLDVIFSCCVCNATFSEAYEGHNESVHMPSDGINPDDRTVTRLFLASCCHVFCSKHLEGGGAPFHPEKQRPRAACPVCTKHGELYSVRGFAPGQYDPAIPSCWFVTPPVQLDSSGKEMEALRFQYMSLLTYSRKVSNDRKQCNKELAELRSKLDQVTAFATEEHSKVIRLEHENQRLRDVEKEQLKFKKREPLVQHYLKVIPELVDRNRLMDARLSTLGFKMRFPPLDYKPFGETDSQEGADDHGGDHSRTASNFTGHRSADTLVNAEEPPTSSSQDRPLKRQRIDSPAPDSNIHARKQQQRGLSSRDGMPPPKKPLSRMKSVKKLLFHKKRSGIHASPVVPSDPPLGPGNHASEMESLPEEDELPVASKGYPQHTPYKGDWEGSDQYMTGAIPVLRSDRPSPLAPHPPTLRREFSFRSPLQRTAARQPLPNEPSYMRLMDGLSDDNHLDLGLSDPRFTSSPQPVFPTDHYMEDQQTPGPAHTNDHGRWNYGHAFLHQSPKRPPSSTYQHPDPLRSNPTGHRSQLNRPSDPVTPAPPRAQYNGGTMPFTPAPQQPQFPGQMEDSVVSRPFYNSKNRIFYESSDEGVNERDDSYIRNFADYPSQRPIMTTERTGRPKPLSLNGLSFFDTPLNINNEPIKHGWAFAPHIQRRSGNLTSRGLIRRPAMLPLPLPNHTQILQPRLSLPPGPTYSTLHVPAPSQQKSSRPAPLPRPVPNISSQRSKEPHGQARRAGTSRSRGAELPRSRIRSSAFAQPSRSTRR